jgi:2-keto-4-pentenoate hydratase/2-oxohepta-3-ene-1,7-dioic acid hydratase in catechol pathway
MRSRAEIRRSNIATEAALDCVYGYAVGIDFTRRDLQAEAKKLGRPWEVAKAFEHSAPVSAIVPAARLGHPWPAASGSISTASASRMAISIR